MISRRRLVVASPLLLLPSAAWATAIPPSKTLSFRITCKGAEIGSHTLSFSGDPGSDFTARAEVQVAVRVLGVRLFHYTHHMVETWSGGRFVSLDATTDDDGDKAFATVRRSSDGLSVDGSSGKYTAPGNTLPATHWNIAEMKSPMLNPENGRMIHATIGGPSSDTVPTVSGKSIAATHYTWRGDDTLDLYYAADGTWAGLTALAKDGSKLVYTRV
ncbi:MAG TPA: DUF6134 family protein [Rhizomicrobium sp.]|jgi:hypothetical protein